MDRLSGIVAALAAGWVVGAAGADIIYVDASASGADDGTSWADAFADLADALAGASAGDQVWVAAGSYYPPGVNSPFLVPSEVKVYGGFAGGETALDQRDWAANLTILDGDFNGDDAPVFLNRGDNARTVVEINNPAVGTRLDGLVITGGYAVGGAGFTVGGGLDASFGSMAVANCLFIDNGSESIGGACAFNQMDEVRIIDSVFTANATHPDPTGGAGGAVWFAGTTLTVEGSTFVLNLAQGATGGDGGAISAQADEATIADCVFIANSAQGGTAGIGGAVLLASAGAASMTVERCTFRGNQAQGGTAGDGGGLATITRFGGVVRVEDCLFEANTGSSGGGMMSLSPALEVVRTRFIGNSVEGIGAGGGLSHASLDPSTVHIVSCEFIGNEAEGSGGGLSVWGSLQPAVITVTNSVLSGNSAGGFGAGAALSGEVEIVNTTIADNAATVSSGAGVFMLSADPLTVSNAIVWGNRAAGAGGEAAQVDGIGGAMTVEYSCVEGWTGALGGAGSFDGDPLFVDPDGADGVPGTGDDAYRLGPFSPCIDAARNQAVPTDDLDVDDDGDTGERLPLDVYEGARRLDDVDVPDTGSGVAPLVDIGAAERQIRSCPADLTGDGVLDFFDVQEYLNLYSGGDLAADFTGDGVLDFFDVLLFLALFSAGCA